MPACFVRASKFYLRFLNCFKLSLSATVCERKNVFARRALHSLLRAVLEQFDIVLAPKTTYWPQAVRTFFDAASTNENTSPCVEMHLPNNTVRNGIVFQLRRRLGRALSLRNNTTLRTRVQVNVQIQSPRRATNFALPFSSPIASQFHIFHSVTDFLIGAL